MISVTPLRTPPQTPQTPQTPHPPPQATRVLTAICAGFLEGTEPEVCICANANINTAAALEGCVEAVNHPGKGDDDKKKGDRIKDKMGSDGVPWWVVLVIVLVLLSSGGLFAFLYWRRTQQQMRDQVRGILAEYVPALPAPLRSSPPSPLPALHNEAAVSSCPSWPLINSPPPPMSNQLLLSSHVHFRDSARYMPLEEGGGGGDGGGGVSTSAFNIQPKPFTEMMSFTSSRQQEANVV